MKYIENQFAWIAALPLGAINLFLIISYIYQWGSAPMPFWLFLIVMPLFLIILLLFYRMKISVDRKQIIVSYGIGLVRKKINITEIEDIIVARNKWYYGLGIRVLKGGMLYNIHTLKGIEIRFKEKPAFIRIGSQTPEKLIAEINMRIKHAHK